MKRISFIIALIFIVFTSCKHSESRSKSARSRTIGWKETDMKAFGFDDPQYLPQKTGPGLVFVQGGTFTMGRVEEDVMKDWNNVPRRVTVASFYIDETEVTNYDYRIYTAWLRKVYPSDVKKQEAALPDTLVWRRALAYNEPYVNNYFRHPAYANYPVVGVSWTQATEYCKWRTDRVNENILITNGYLTLDTAQQNSTVFTTEGYLSGNYQGAPGKNDQRVRWENGLLLPNYRLPTEAEWEYAALGLIGEADGELLTDRRMYPWAGQYIRESNKKNKGQMKANYTRGRGDLMGMAGALNDNADIAADVFAYAPNDYQIYNMAGNVNEWVADVYRPLSPSDVEEFQPFRGNVITEYVKDANGKMMFDQYGQPITKVVADYRNYNDGDYQSNLITGKDWTLSKPSSAANNDSTTRVMYIQPNTNGYINAQITDRIRVYKGGSWKDRAFWLNPGARRYLDERESAMDLGFRCAMTRLGSPGGL